MLDETTCPVCGKDLTEDEAEWVEYGSRGSEGSRQLQCTLWAVAHYLAHLVQQKQPSLVLDEAGYPAQLQRSQVDNIPPPTR